MVLTLLRLVLGGLVVFAVLPRYVFLVPDVEDADRSTVSMAFMTLWIMVIGYLIAALHIYSGVMILLLLAITGWLFHRRALNRYQLSRGQEVSATVYDTFASSRSVAIHPAAWFKRVGRDIAARIPHGFKAWILLLVVLAVLSAAGWMRFDATWGNAAPFFSDAPETIQWVKGIDAHDLFPTGIYPMGYYMVMAVVQTLTHSNVIVFEKLFSAAIGTLLTASVMWSTYRFSGRAVPAIAAGVVYGLFPHLMPYTASRQISAEAQEFGNLWVLPIAWWVFQSWVTRRRGYVWAASAALAVVGLTHPVALLNAALAAIAATLAAWIVVGIPSNVFTRYLWMVPTAAVTAIAPLAIAYLVGIPLLGTALPFLAAKTLGVALPAITPLVWIALAGILVIFITKLLWYDHLYEMGIPGTAFLLLVFAEGIVQLPRFGFHSLVLAQRAGAFLALVEAFGIGLGVAGIQEAAERLGVQRSAAALGTLVATVACSVTLAYRWPLRPLQGYTMSSDTEVAEIVHIETTLPNFSWDLVANNDYAFALGQGYQYDPSYWIAHVNPRYAWPHWHTPGSKPYSLDQRYIFFFVSHRLTMPDVPGRLALLRSDRQQEALLRHWINNWTKRHGPMPIYFHNPDLTVYWLRNPSNPAT